MHRINGDGTERPEGDLYRAQIEAYKHAGVGAAGAMAVWGPDGADRKEVLLARLDGFMTALRVSGGALLAALNAGERTTGMARLKDRAGRPCLDVGAQNGVQLFGSDCRLIGRATLPVVALAGPGGYNRDCVYTVDAAGATTVLRLRAEKDHK